MENKPLNCLEIVAEAEKKAQKLFRQIEETALQNQRKVLLAFRHNNVAARHFAPTTGYGYDDSGRDVLGKVFAEAFGAESALVSPNITSGTHALTIALFGLLKSGDKFFSVTGKPYDTLMEVICGDGNGSLADFGISYGEIPLGENGKPDLAAISSMLQAEKPALIMLTRSKGYAWRDALSINDIEEVVRVVKEKSPSTVVFVDNCYGEFINTVEPTAVGVDVIGGSLIKNPGGGLAPTGGYIAGKEKLINRIAGRLTAPSVGAEIGSYFGSYMPFYEGFFLAPSVVANALKGSVLAAYAFESIGCKVNPPADSRPNDIIRSVMFDSADELITYIRSIQFASPVDSNVTPYPWEMPGYADKVIMAAGTFVQGASIELSSDSPIRAPYIAYTQGGLTYEHCKIALTECLDGVIKNRKV